MARKCDTEEEILQVLREAGAAGTIFDVCRRKGAATGALWSEAPLSVAPAPRPADPAASKKAG